MPSAFLALGGVGRTCPPRRLRISLRRLAAGAGKPQRCDRLAASAGEIELAVRLAISLENFWVIADPFEGDPHVRAVARAGGRARSPSRPGTSLLCGLVVPGGQYEQAQRGERGEPGAVPRGRRRRGDCRASASGSVSTRSCSGSPSGLDSSWRRASDVFGGSVRPAARRRRSALSASSCKTERDFEGALELFGRSEQMCAEIGFTWWQSEHAREHRRLRVPARADRRVGDEPAGGRSSWRDEIGDRQSVCLWPGSHRAHFGGQTEARSGRTALGRARGRGGTCSPGSVGNREGGVRECACSSPTAPSSIERMRKGAPFPSRPRSPRRFGLPPPPGRVAA